MGRRAVVAVDPDPGGAATVQELVGGQFGEMSTFMNYAGQSPNFCEKAQLQPFCDLIASSPTRRHGRAVDVRRETCRGAAHADKGVLKDA